MEETITCDPGFILLREKCHTYVSLKKGPLPKPILYLLGTRGDPIGVDTYIEKIKQKKMLKFHFFVD